jgi:beta-exotoxin I transport system permease protein
VILAARLIRDRRRSLVWWSIGVVGLVLFTVALFPSLKDQASLNDVVDQLPEALRSMFGISTAIPLTSPAGYLQGRLFGSLLPLVLIVFGIGLGARAVAGSEQDGTLELLLANPVTRGSVVVQRYAAVVAMIAGLTAVFAVSLVVLGLPFGALDGVPVAGLVGVVVATFGITLLHATIAFGVGAASGRRALATSTATVVAVAGYLLQGLLGLSDAVAPLRFVDPWHWYLGRNMLAQGVAPDGVVVPLVLSAAIFGAGAVAFMRRDLR